jgi:hypothetical protein
MLAPSYPLNRNSNLKQLAIATQQAKPNSLEYRQHLSRLLIALQQSNQLLYLQRQEFPNFYEEIQAIGLQKLFFNLGQSLQNYRAQHDFLAWLHSLQQQYYAQAAREVLANATVKACPPLTLAQLSLISS